MKHKLIILVMILTAALFLGCKTKPEANKDEAPAPATDSVAVTTDDSKSTEVEKDAPGTVGKNSMDEWIDGYEKVVIAYEKSAADGTLSKKELPELNKKMEALSDKQNEKNMSPAQLSRLTGLILRLTKVMQKIKPF